MTERLLSECPKCGARNGCEKHGLSKTGIDYRARYASPPQTAMLVDMLHKGELPERYRPQ